jgi:2-polyprenyl-3-methyl-5-hydroxy-6-metoxy-1,4-benzoquinol methylase
MKFQHPNFDKPPLSFKNNVPCFIETSNYTNSFGLQWSNFSKTQLDSNTNTKISKNRMLRMFGSLYKDLPGKTVLEVGCGSGRFTELLLERDVWLTAFDPSVAVFENFKNNGSNPKLRLIRSTIETLPFLEESYDLVFCPGVIQHTPNPKNSIKLLYNQIKPGGWLVLDQYRYNLSSLLKTTGLIRKLIKPFNAETKFKLTNSFVSFWLPIHKVASRNRFLEMILFRFSPITAHYSGYPELSDKDQIEWARLSTHDNLTDFYKHRTFVYKFKKEILKLGAVNVSLCVMPYTIELKCQKPIREDMSIKNNNVKIIKLKNVASG